MSQRYRTTCFADVLVNYPGSLEETPGWRKSMVGFRLVRDNETGVARGSLWSSPRFAALGPGSSRYMAHSSGPVFSIRLCVDWSADK